MQVFSTINYKIEFQARLRVVYNILYMYRLLPRTYFHSTWTIGPAAHPETWDVGSFPQCHCCHYCHPIYHNVKHSTRVKSRSRTIPTVQQQYTYLLCTVDIMQPISR